MDREALRRDMETDPGLAGLAFETVEDLAAHLVALHRTAQTTGLGCLGYLYRKQTERVRQLKQELEDAKRKR